MDNFHRKIALVTGAGQRLGRKIALHLSQLGFDIAIHYNRSTEEAKKLQAEILQKGSKANLFRADLSLLNAIPKLFDELLSTMGSPSLLINNASTFKADSLKNLTPPELTRQIQINAVAPLLLTQQFAFNCKEGLIINMVDSRTDWHDIDYFSYSLSKKMLTEITKMSAKALPPSIRVNGIAPGAILPPKEKDQTLSKNKEIKGIDRSKQICQTVEFILNNDYINGEVLFIDGGIRLNQG